MDYRRIFVLTSTAEAGLGNLATAARQRRARSAVVRTGITVLSALHGYASPEAAASALYQLWPNERNAMVTALRSIAEVLDELGKQR